MAPHSAPRNLERNTVEVSPHHCHLCIFLTFRRERRKPETWANGPHCFMSLPEMAPHPVLRSLSQEAHAVRWISLCTDTAASRLTHTEALLPPSYSSALVMASNHIQEPLLAGMAAGSFDGLLPGEALSTW